MSYCSYCPWYSDNQSAMVNHVQTSHGNLNPTPMPFANLNKKPMKANTPLQTDAELELNSLLNDVHQACKKVEADGASYAHMPEYYKAVEAVKAFFEASFLERALATVGEVEGLHVSSRTMKPYKTEKNVQRKARDKLRAEIRTKLNQAFGGK